jgi:uncharacterized membrane protein YgcG
MRARWAVAVTAAFALAFAGPALSAAATPPVDLGTGHLADTIGVFTPAEADDAEATLADVYEKTGNDLYVVIVDEFTSPADSQQWADAVAERNGLGATQYLLAISVENPQYYISADSSGPLSNAQLDAIERDLRPFLSARDFPGAIDSAAAGFVDASGGSGANPLIPSVGDMLTTVLVVVAVIAVIALVVVLVVRARRKRTSAPGGAVDAPVTPQVPLADLQQHAASALIDTDDAVRTSEQELGFAAAQFGDEATTEFSAALQSAREKLAQAFSLQQQLDDEVPDSEAQVRAWNEQIVQLCTEANQGLDDKAQAFDELRKLEADAPAALVRARDARTAAASAIEASATKLATLQQSYAPEALATIDDNVEQARARIAFADEQLAEAQKALDGGDSGESAVGIRAAEEAVGQAVVLENAIDTLATDLDAGEQQAAAVIAGIEQDVRTAMTLPDPDGRVAAVLAVTRGELDAARADLASARRRPLQTLQALQESDRRIDEVVQSVRDAAARAQRVGQQLGSEIAQAQAQVSAAESFIAARRGAVGAEARTRLAEAGAALTRAQHLQTADPDQALSEAQRANSLAGQAIEYARTDVGGFSNSGGLFGGGGGGGGSDFMGALLGGIVGSAISGGGRSSGGFGGFGSFGGGVSRGSFGGGASRRSSSFGGGGSRGRRGGGRF